ncbi:MAG: hypothetical protein HY611_02195, partial [Elusimicrobia bacterium]|nr:hypothetical protein [Elusimicrobiota bacterium]
MKINLWAGFLIAVFVAVLFGAWYLLQTRHTKPNAPEPDKKAIEAAVQSLLRASKTFSPPSESAAAMTGEFPSGPYQQVNNLVHHLAALPSKKRAAECLVVFREAERLLEDGGREAGEVVAHGLLESVQNITSHADAGAKRVDFERFLGVKSRGEWDRLDELWNQALSA